MPAGSGYNSGPAQATYLVDPITGQLITAANPLAVSTNVSSQSKPATAADSVTSSANTAAVITYAAAGVGVSNVLGQVIWSYSAAPTGGLLKVEDGAGNIVFQVDITAAGPGFFQFPSPIKGLANTALIITLAAGGAAVVGRINARKWTE